jgi:hypothetical protein
MNSIIKTFAKKSFATITDAVSKTTQTREDAVTTTSSVFNSFFDALSNHAAEISGLFEKFRSIINADKNSTAKAPANVAATKASIVENASDTFISPTNTTAQKSSKPVAKLPRLGNNSKDPGYVNKDVNSPTGFSDDPIGTLERKLGFPMPSSFRTLDVFNLDVLQDCQSDLMSVVKQVNIMKKASVDVHELSEIGRYPFITPILNAVTAFKEIKHYAQYPLWGGAIAHGQPDWALIYKDKPIFIVEGKVNIDNAAIAQTVLQMYEAHMRMRPKNYVMPWTMFGMITTAVEVIFVRAVFHEKRCTEVSWNGGVLQIPHDEDTKDDEYIEGVVPVFKHMETMLISMISQFEAAHKPQPWYKCRLI